MSIAGNHIFQTYGVFRSIRARFTSVVGSGDTLVIEMWKEGSDVLYRVRVAESGMVCIATGMFVFGLNIQKQLVCSEIRQRSVGSLRSEPNMAIVAVLLVPPAVCRAFNVDITLNMSSISPFQVLRPCVPTISFIFASLRLNI